MSRTVVLALIVVSVCLAAMAGAQDGWRSSPPPRLAQSGQAPAPASAMWSQTPGPAAMQNVQYPAQSYTTGNYDLPPQPVANNPQQLIVTRQTQIPLPVKITPANLDKLSSVELVYSMDRGQNWHSYQHLSPAELTTFEFNTAGDAEYWFVLRAIHKTGEIKHIGPTPVARVLVDTVPPKVTLDARRNASGEVIIEWTAEDVSLKNVPPTIALSYDSNMTWMTLAADMKNVKREGNRETGHVTFWPRHEAEAVEIRCEVEDAAENREIKTTRLVLKPSQNANDSETTMTPMGIATPAVVQPVPDVMVMPPRPLVGTPHQRTAQNTVESNSTAPPNNILADLLQNMSTMAPTAIAANITQPYASNVTTTAPNLMPPSDNAPAVVEETPPFPGKIASVQSGKVVDDPLVGYQSCIIANWLSGDATYADSKVDLYRSDTKYGPWRPIAFDLKNTGQHYWLVAPVDKMPFYLRIDLRSTQGLYTDFTVQPIAIPLSLEEPAQNLPAEQILTGNQSNPPPGML